MRSGQRAASGGRVPDSLTDRVTGRRIHLLDWQAANRRGSWFLAALTVALYGVVAYAVSWVWDPASALLFTGLAGALAVAQSVGAFAFGDRWVLAATGARPATRDEHRYLMNVTEAVSLGAGVPPPRPYVIDADAPNAFATGRNPENASIVVTSGLLHLLERQELEGVVAHEIAHVRNYDVRFSMMLAATVGGLVLLREVVLRSVAWGGGRGRRRGGGGAVGLVVVVLLLVLAPLLATILRLAVSRRREYLADATAAYITRNPEGLARALERIAGYGGTPLRANEGVRHLFFVQPARGGGGRGWWSTHPPIEDRIDRLRRM